MYADNCRGSGDRRGACLACEGCFESMEGQLASPGLNDVFLDILICVHLCSSAVKLTKDRELIRDWLRSVLLSAFRAFFCGYYIFGLIFAPLRLCVRFFCLCFRSWLFCGLTDSSIHVARFFPRLLDGRQGSPRLPMKFLSLGVFHRFESAGYGGIRR